jgi:DNA modification methylase
MTHRPSSRVSAAGRAIETGVVYCDDNLLRMAQLFPDSVDLVYLDPPFFSNRHYEVIWGDEAEVRSFEDRWEGGIYHYVEWMKERAIEIKRVLKPTGTMYLHCDWHAALYLKVMLDDIFGAGNFQNEVIWYYRGAGVSPKRWGRRHDTLLWYSKSKSWYFNPDPVRDAYAESTQERFLHYIGNVRGGHDFGEQKLNPLGKHPDDVWPIKIVAPSARIRLGYPTQKPEELLQRVILSSSREGDVVLDPFAGCGTTVVVAQKLKRRWIGIDISPTACNLIHRQLLRAGAPSVRMVGMPTSIDDLRALKPFEFQNWVIDRINGIQTARKSGDMGVDGWTFFLHEPVQIKQSERIGRDVVDTFETAVSREGKKRGFLIAFGFTSGSHEECSRARRSGIDIQLVTVADLLERHDRVLARMGAPKPAQLPGMEETPLPHIESSRRSAEELIASSKSARPAG